MPFSLTTRTSLRKPASSDLVDNDGILDYNWDKIEDDVIATTTGITVPGDYTGQVTYDSVYNGYFWWNGTQWEYLGLARSYVQGDPPGTNTGYTLNIPINVVTPLPVAINNYTGTGVIERSAGSNFFRMEEIGTYWIQVNTRFVGAAAAGQINVGIQIWDPTNTTLLLEYIETVSRNSTNGVICMQSSYMHRSTAQGQIVRFAIFQTVVNPLVITNSFNSFTMDIAFIRPKLGVNF